MLHLIIGQNKNGVMELEGAMRIDAFSWDADLIGSLVESNSLFGEGEEKIISFPSGGLGLKSP